MAPAYAAAGVDLDHDESFIDDVKEIAKSTFRPEVLSSIGGFAGMFKAPDRYKNPVFVAATDGVGTKLKLAAQIGRYDTIGQVFGRSRPATGFSLDLKALAKISPKTNQSVLAIYAPLDADPAQREKIKQLRAQGARVICELSNQQGGVKEMQCDRVLVKEQQKWVVKDAS